MPLIKCIDCGKMISDRIENCPECGCPVSISVEENKKLQAKTEEEARVKAEEKKKRIEEEIKAPAVKVEVDVDSELDTLYDIFAPAILNEHEIESVGSELTAYFKKYNEIGNGVVYAACYGLEREIEKHAKVLKEVAKMRNQQLQMALNQYKSEMNKPVEGLGFGIITNSVADAALYSAMSARNAAKQYMKNTNTANANLQKNLQAIGVNNDTLMSESDVINFKYQLRHAIETIKELADTKYFIDSHKEFIYHPEKYNNGAEIDGVSLYSILYRGENTRLLYSGGPKGIIDRNILAKAEKEGYVVLHPGSYYCTTLKYEKEVLEAIYMEENPEEYAKMQAEKQGESEVIYNKAIEDLNNGLYYEAATALGSISGYKDAIEISVKLWHEKILCPDRILMDTLDYYGLKDDGTVLVSNRNEEVRAKIEKWQGVEKLYNMAGLGALTFDGRLLGTRDLMYGGFTGDYIAGSYADWKNLKSIVGRFHYIGIKKNGKLIAMGKNEYGECNIEGITNFKKIHIGGASRTAILTNDGKVKVVGLDNSPGYENWENIVDVVSDYPGIFGFKEDGTVCYAARKREGALEKYKTYRGTHPDEWKNIYKYLGGCRAIDKYGRLYSYGSNEKDGKLDGLKDIVYVYEDGTFLACIKADGTLLPIESKVDISKWENVISIWGDYRRAVGLKADGTVICDGDIENPEELRKWKLFEHINKLRNVKEEFIAKKRAEDEKELNDCKNELANLRGFFTGARRKQLEARIAELKEDLK